MLTSLQELELDISRIGNKLLVVELLPSWPQLLLPHIHKVLAVVKAPLLPKPAVTWHQLVALVAS
jgi:hypothetical protein